MHDVNAKAAPVDESDNEERRTAVERATHYASHVTWSVVSHVICVITLWSVSDCVHLDDAVNESESEYGVMINYVKALCTSISVIYFRSSW